MTSTARRELLVAVVVGLVVLGALAAMQRVFLAMQELPQKLFTNCHLLHPHEPNRD